MRTISPESYEKHIEPKQSILAERWLTLSTSVQEQQTAESSTLQHWLEFDELSARMQERMKTIKESMCSQEEIVSYSTDQLKYVLLYYNMLCQYGRDYHILTDFTEIIYIHFLNNIDLCFHKFR